MQGGVKANKDEGGFSVQTAAMRAGVQALPSSPAPPCCARAEAADGGTEWTAMVLAGGSLWEVLWVCWIQGKDLVACLLPSALVPYRSLLLKACQLLMNKALKNVPSVETCFTFLCPFATALPASCISPGNDIFGISCFKAGVYFSCSNEC